MRRVLTNRRRSESCDLAFGGRAYVISTSLFADGSPGEMFISSDRPTSNEADAARDGAVLVSLALQYGVPLSALRGAITRLNDGSAASIIGAAIDILGEE